MKLFAALAALAFGLTSLSAEPAHAEEPWPAPVHDNMIDAYALFDLLEYEGGGSDNNIRWDVVGWVGGDYNKVWVKTEGSHEARRGEGDADAQVLYGRLVTPFLDFQIGARQQWQYGKGKDMSRVFGVIGLQGLAPYWFDIEPSLFISEDGDVSARFTAEYDLLLTQRLILQPRFETDLAVQKVERFGVGRGINDVDMGLRLRYEIIRKFAPYIGLSWRHDVGETAALARKEGKDVESLSVVAGVRLWY